MTLNEAKILADNGNVDAMMALAKHYFKDSDNDESYELACMYQERAAEAGDPNALVELVQSSRTVAKVAFQFLEQNGNNAGIVRDLENTHKWASKLFHVIQQYHIHGDAEQLAIDAYIDSIYWLSAVYCVEENYSGILRITKDIALPIAQALYGLALFHQTETVDEAYQAFDFLKNAMNPCFWSEEYAKTQTMELLRVETVCALSHMYRIHNDTSSAYDVLTTALTQIKDSELRKIIQNNIACYRKTLFGGYKYIG